MSDFFSGLAQRLGFGPAPEDDPEYKAKLRYLTSIRGLEPERPTEDLGHALALGSATDVVRALQRDPVARAHLSQPLNIAQTLSPIEDTGKDDPFMSMIKGGLAGAAGAGIGVADALANPLNLIEMGAGVPAASPVLDVFNAARAGAGGADAIDAAESGDLQRMAGSLGAMLPALHRPKGIVPDVNIDLPTSVIERGPDRRIGMPEGYQSDGLYITDPSGNRIMREQREFDRRIPEQIRADEILAGTGDDATRAMIRQRAADREAANLDLEIPEPTKVLDPDTLEPFNPDLNIEDTALGEAWNRDLDSGLLNKLSDERSKGPKGDETSIEPEVSQAPLGEAVDPKVELENFRKLRESLPDGPARDAMDSRVLELEDQLGLTEPDVIDVEGKVLPDENLDINSNDLIPIATRAEPTNARFGRDTLKYNRKSYVDQKYPGEFDVIVRWEDGTIHHDTIKGLNQGHALRRAKENWPDSQSIEIEGKVINEPSDLQKLDFPDDVEAPPKKLTSESGVLETGEDPHKGLIRWSDDEWISPDEAQRRAEGDYSKTLDDDFVSEERPSEANLMKDDVAYKTGEEVVTPASGGQKQLPPPPNTALAVKQPGRFHLNFKEWVNNRSASEITSQRAYKLFEPFRSFGMGDIDIYQAGNGKGRVPQMIKAFTDGIHQAATKAGIKLNYRQNYIPQYWKETPAQVQAAARRMGIRPGFSLDRVFNSYAQGRAAGLTPLYDNLPDIMERYARDVNRAISNQGFWNYLTDNGMISTRQTPGTKYIDPELFPNARGRAFWAKPEVADKINNYLRPGISTLSKAADKVSDVKNVVMSAGVPGTAINAHGVNIAAANALSSQNPLKGLWTGLKYMFNTKSASKFIETNLNQADRLVRAGLKLTSEEHPYKPGKPWKEQLAEAKGEFGYKKLRKAHELLFEEGLFQRMIPALKIERALELEKTLVSKGMSAADALDTAVHQTNNAFGGINIDELGRSKNTQNLARVFFNAPDWLESHGRMAHGVAKSLLDPKNPKGAFYRRVIRNVGIAYVLSDAVNKSVSGKHMIENQSGQEGTVNLGEIKTPSGATKLRQAKPLGTRIDFLKIPFDVAMAIANDEPQRIPRILSYRLSIPMQAALQIMSDKDWKGDPILGTKGKFGKERTVGQRVKSLGDVALDLGAPSYIKAGYDKIGDDDKVIEETIMNILEAPMLYPYKRRGPKKKKSEFDIDLDIPELDLEIK